MNSTTGIITTEEENMTLMGIAIASTLFGVISEILPFCKNCKGNGIFETILNAFCAKKDKPPEEPDDNV
mgnify:CR=1 FL=1|tara:strand:- start:365 stop:571 length:207 start_codon:yes stop_codon:yes gene_type:complete